MDLRNEIKKLKRRSSVGLEKTIEEQQKTIEELRKENTSLLAYKKFFGEVKLKMDSFPN